MPLMVPHPLAGVPDTQAQEDAEAWLDTEARFAASLEKNAFHGRETFPVTVKSAESVGHAVDDTALQKFILAVLLADWTCYARSADREEYAHLHNVIAAFPQGFRLWMVRLDEKCLPIGYTGFHPIAKRTFDMLRTTPERITSRKQILPEAGSQDQCRHFYLYNIGIIKQFHGTETSRALVKAFARDVAAVKKNGLAAIVISPDGARVVERFGLRQSGYITHEGHREIAFVREELALPS